MNFVKKIILYPFVLIKRKQLFNLRKKVNNHLLQINLKINNKNEDYVLTEGIYDTPNHYLRLKIILEALIVLKKKIYPIGIVLGKKSKFAIESLKALGIKIIFNLEDGNKYNKVIYNNIIKKISNEKDLLNIKFVSKIPAYIFYDTILHITKKPKVKITSDGWKIHLKNFLKIENFYLNLFKKFKFKYVILSHPWKSYYALPVWIAIQKKIPVFYVKSENQTLRIKKILNKRDFKIPFEYMPYKNFCNLSSKLQKKFVNLGKFSFKLRIEGLSKDLNSQNAFLNNKLISKKEMKEKLGIKNNNPIVFIYAHAWYDFPHCLDMSNFVNFYEWILFTYKTVLKIKDINWIFKSHPLEEWYGKPNLRDIISSNFKNVYLVDQEINTFSSIKNSDCVVTVFGTVGIEATILGKPALICDKSYYQEWGIGTHVKSLEQYKYMLNNLSEVKTPSVKTKELALAFFYFAFSPHEKEKNLINFVDDYDSIKVHKSFLNFSFEEYTHEHNEIKYVSSWINSKEKNYSQFVKLNFL